MNIDVKQQSPQTEHGTPCHNEECPDCFVYKFVPPTEPIRVHIARKNIKTEDK